ncbi:tetraacyldisaccharide 4'-kinase [Pseudoalteromonas undina]|uniref:Tetraacyldisaccharide 4'-kinase n=1 Tax=Pseudoalteromonas undina TaxID=43660 RepID=A0ABP2XY19_9GAMM|nr:MULTISPECIES: tetraacyldisaccharide 4'-kinase [Pseudoalteromonas]KAF7766318.1 tetraacyldisaccharide 4'-kinase [Pseudoalteromonas undina]KPZ65541.1 Tetraacyldisaccharide 4'-kinase [Pseudoalteromonas sp. P1-16-1b]OLF80086.1 tetraacyldisaccharide 4'-kinase [Pseudoalteromonas haloplanktis]
MSKIEQSWYKPFSLITLLLLPLSAIFGCVALVRKYCYEVGVFKPFVSNTPVIVVGNISVGGNGKTPFVLWLHDYLTAQGLSVGLISRGYGGQAAHYPLLVTANTTTLEAGDEPVLLFNRLQCPLVVGPNRQQNIEMLNHQFQLDVIISDDGMQHYKMARSIECCIVDSERKFGNGFLMPAGPLRETVSRLNSVDLVIENGSEHEFSYRLQPSIIKRVADNTEITTAIETAHAVSAIGNPQRFEASLKAQGIALLSTHHFRDHYAYTANDFAQFGEDCVLMTEKDAVKCRDFAKPNWYYLPVDAQPTAAVINTLNLLLKEKGIHHGL